MSIDTPTAAVSAWISCTVWVSVTPLITTEPFTVPQMASEVTMKLAVAAPRVPNRSAAHTMNGSST